MAGAVHRPDEGFGRTAEIINDAARRGHHRGGAGQAFGDAALRHDFRNQLDIADAVLRCPDIGALVHHRARVADRLARMRILDEEDDDIHRPRLGMLGRGLDRNMPDVAAVVENQPVLPHRLDVRPVRIRPARRPRRTPQGARRTASPWRPDPTTPTFMQRLQRAEVAERHRWQAVRSHPEPPARPARRVPSAAC